MYHTGPLQAVYSTSLKFVILAPVSIRNVTRTHFKPLSINNSFSLLSITSVRLYNWSLGTSVGELILLNSGPRAHSAAAVGSVVVLVVLVAAAVHMTRIICDDLVQNTFCRHVSSVDPASRTCHASKTSTRSVPLWFRGSWLLCLSRAV